ncbi:MAG: alpha/beta fold hydrolase, partial [Pseudomonadota bacterium]
NRRFRLLPAPALVSAGLLLALASRADQPSPREITAWFQPDRIQQATLSSDGHHLAYTVHEDAKTVIILTDVDNPSKGEMVGVGEDTVIQNSRDHEKTPIRVPFFHWAGPNRLVFSAEIPGVSDIDIRRTHEPTNITIVYAVDADGRNLLKLANADDVALVSTADTPDADTNGSDSTNQPREPRVLGFAADDPESVLVEAARPALGSDSNDPNLFGRLATGVFKFNVRTGKRSKVAERDVNGTLIYDRQGNPRIELWQPIDKRVQSFFYLASPLGKAAKGADKMIGDDVSPENYLGTRTFPVGFDFNPNILYIASNVGRDTYGLYALDLHEGKRTPLAVEHPAFDLTGFEPGAADAALVFDRSRRQLVGVRVRVTADSTQWLDPELGRVQAELDGKFPGRNVRIEEWDEARARFLVLVSGTADPGRYFVFHRAEDRLVQFARRAPMNLDQINAATPFAFDTPEGVHLTGYLTLPRTPLVNPPPLLVDCHAGPWDRDDPGYNRDAQVLASMGFVVAQVNYRGSAGFGTRYREALRADIDQIPIGDIRAAIAWIATQHKFDRKRVALLGEGFGGYLALRALQLYPDEFRCAVAINAPTDLEAWTKKSESWQETVDRQQDTTNYLQSQQDFMMNFGRSASGPLALAPLRVSQFPGQSSMAAPASGGGGGPALPPPNLVNFSGELRRWYFGQDAKRLAAISPARHPEQLTKPVLLIQDPFDVSGESGESSALRSALAHTSNPADYLETTGEFTRRLPAASTQVFAKMEDFFNLNVYDFNVKIGETKVQK